MNVFWKGRLWAAVVAWMLVLAAPARAGLISESQEVTIGQQAASEIEAEYPLYNEIGMNERLNRIAGQLLTRAERPLAWRFRILDIEELNAMALPGGIIYATRGLLQTMPDGQAAFVLAHEIQHVERRHSVRQLEAELYRQIGLAAAIQLLSGGRLSEGASNTIALANMVVANRYTQDMEREADLEGIRMMARAGLDPQGAVDSLRTLQKHSEGSLPGFVNALIGTHPLTEDRIRVAEEQVDLMDFDIPPTASSAPSPLVLATPVPESQIPPTDSLREAQTMLSLQTGRFRFQPDPHLMRQALYLQANPPERSVLAQQHAVVVLTFASSLNEAGLNARLLDQELPDLLGQRTFVRYGASLVRTADGRRRLVLVLN